jgi:hypothetical protein
MSSKILKDREHVEACVEVEGVGRLVLNVDSRGGYSLRGYPDEGDVASGGGLLAVGVVHAEAVEAVQLRVTPNTRTSENSPSAHPGE